MRAAYKDKRKELRKDIAKSKMDCWRMLCDDVEEDIWADGRKIAMKSLNQNFPKTEIERDRRIEIAGTLFPQVEEVAWETADVNELPL